MKNRKLLLSVTVPFLLLLAACNKTPATTVAPTTAPVTATPIPTTVPATPTPTPIEENNEDTPLVPVFSKAGGFYDESFLLTLSSEEGTKIFFTTDGTDPRTSCNARVYTQGITIYDNTNEPNVYSQIKDISLNKYYPPNYQIDKGINVRAVVQAADGTFGPIVTNSYFIGKTASYYTDLRVISLVTDADYLFDEDNGAYMVGARYYDWKNSPDYVPYDPSDVQNVTNYNFDGRESEFPVTIQVIENGSAVYTTDAGARISGNWSRSAFQKSLRLYARKEYGDSKLKYAFFEDLTDEQGKIVKKYDKVTLRNGGNDHILHFRDAFIQDLAKDTSCDIMNSQPYILFINGEFWGFYLLREKPEDYYIKSHYGIDDAQVTVIKNGGLESGTDEAYGDYWAFCDWAIKSDMTKDSNYKKFCEQMDVLSFIDYMAIETYGGNTDWAYGYLNNWMVWRSEIVDPALEKADKKWRFILYDLDISAGLYGNNDTSHTYNSLGSIDVPWNDFNYAAMLKNLCNNKEFLETFYNRYMYIIEDCFAIEKVDALLNKYTAAYKEATQATHHRFGNGWAADSYDKEAEGLLYFFIYRPKYAKMHLDEFCGKVNTQENNNVTEYTKELHPSNWWYWGDANYRVDANNEVFYVNVPKTLESAWLAQAGESGLTLEKGCTYKVTFEASCNGNGHFELFVNRNDNGNYPTVKIDNFELTDELTRYEVTFRMSMETHDDWNMCFNFGEGLGDFVLQNVTITKVN